nr:MAG TPA: hypothetical protein [Caudoviricetes sp.]
MLTEPLSGTLYHLFLIRTADCARVCLKKAFDI